jgi:hypothetical protein
MTNEEVLMLLEIIEALLDESTIPNGYKKHLERLLVILKGNHGDVD